MVTVAGGYHWTPYRPVAVRDVRYLRDDAIARRRPIERAHGFEVGLALGVHTAVRVEDPDVLVAAMDDYCTVPEVVAIGETGITPTQHANRGTSMARGRSSAPRWPWPRSTTSPCSCTRPRPRARPLARG